MSVRRAPARILVVDDSDAFIELVRPVLEREGYCVESVSRLEDARCAIAERRPDVVLLDLILPDGDGLELCAEIGSRGADAPAVVVASSRPGDAVADALRLGARDFIAKPFRLLELRARVAAAVRDRQTLSQLREEIRNREQSEIERARAEAERDRLRESRARSEERERIAMDLHDGTIQSLYGVTLQLGASARTLGEDGTRAEQHLRVAIERINHVIRDVREYVAVLSADRAHKPARATFRSLVAELRAIAPVRVRLSVDADAEDALDDEQLRNLRQIAHEAAFNALRHGRPRSVAIDLDRDGDQIALIVRDDGQGFSVESEAHLRSGGLANMRERTALLGGRIEVNSQIRHGTVVRVVLPLATLPAG